MQEAKQCCYVTKLDFISLVNNNWYQRTDGRWSDNWVKLSFVKSHICLTSFWKLTRHKISLYFSFLLDQLKCLVRSRRTFRSLRHSTSGNSSKSQCRSLQITTTSQITTVLTNLTQWTFSSKNKLDHRILGLFIIAKMANEASLLQPTCFP